MAAGSPNPIVPRPPEVMKERGRRVLEMERGPHLVLSDVGDDDGVLAREPAELVDHELRQDHVAAVLAAVQPVVFLSFDVRRDPFPALFGLTSAIRSASTLLTSPTTGMSALTFLPISEGSMSIWAMVALTANESGLLVTRSSNRVPMPIEQVALGQGEVRRRAAVHARHAQKKRMVAGDGAQAHQRGDGRDVRFFHERDELGARRSELMTPPPAQIRGRFASLMAWDSRKICR